METVSETINGTHNEEHLAFEPIGNIPRAQKGSVFEISGGVGRVFRTLARQTFKGQVAPASAAIYTEYSSRLMQGVWNITRDTDTWISNIATSLSNAIRQNSSAEWPSPIYDGTGYVLGVRV